MQSVPHNKFPFAAVPRIDTRLWGVWDRRHGTWAEQPEHNQEKAERMAVAINEAYAAGFADATITKGGRVARLRRLL